MDDNVFSVESVRREDGKTDVLRNIPTENYKIKNVIINVERIEFGKLGLTDISININGNSSFPTVKLEYQVMPRIV